MFTSKEYLQQKLGVDFEIAKFFVDRKVPANNKYWKGRYLYVAGGTGYTFIPLFFDLAWKLGVSKAQLFDPTFLELCEGILHSAAMHEFEEISFQQHIENCQVLLQHKVINNNLYGDLNTYFADENLKPYKNLGTFSKALNRADTFLFAVAALDIPASVTELIIAKWYALIPSYLLMDDVTDFHEDIERGHENSISDFGEGADGLKKAIAYLLEKSKELKAVNEQLGEYFEGMINEQMETPYFQSIVKQ